MTLTAKESPEVNKTGKPAPSSPDSENKSVQNTRSNPVCLEVEITIRSLPSEAGSLTQPIREEGKTVIVFDNGAVIRSTKNLPVGQKVILSNSRGRDVVCQVVGGRNAPNLKGYVEVEFLEPVNDFWHIHQDVGPLAGVTPPVPFGLHEIPASPSHVSPLASAPFEAHAKPLNGGVGQAPSFEDIPGLVSNQIAPPARETKSEPSRPGLGKEPLGSSDYNLSEITNPSSSLANWNQPTREASANRQSQSENSDPLSMSPAHPAAARDFMSQGLMAYEQLKPSASSSNGKLPLIVGAVVFAVALACGAAYYLRRSSLPASVAKTEVQSQPSAPLPPASNNLQDLAPSPQDAAAQPAAQALNPAQPIAGAQAASADLQPASAPAPLPDIVIGPVVGVARPNSRNAQRQEKKAAAIKEPEAASSRPPAIQNLKMNSPIAPRQGAANSPDGSAQIADIASTAGAGAPTPAGLLTSAGRTSKPPTPPPGATVVFAPVTSAPASPAPASTGPITTSPKLLSSAHVVYPMGARQSKIQGSVSLSITIDADGNVVAATPLSGPLILRQGAADSVRQWKYSPALQDGKPVPSQVTVSVDFRLK